MSPTNSCDQVENPRSSEDDVSQLSARQTSPLYVPYILHRDHGNVSGSPMEIWMAE
jgi:hypothetical protein